MASSNAIGGLGVAIAAALVTFGVLATAVQSAFADKPSTPVTINNPPTAPVPTTVLNPANLPVLTSSVDDPGRTAYQNTMTTTNYMTGNQCSFLFPNVPLGHRLVIQHISGTLNMIGTPSLVAVNLFTPHQGISLFAPFAGNISLFAQSVLLYFDGGEPVQVGISVANTNFTFDQNITLVGYLLDCVASPCSPIAH